MNTGGLGGLGGRDRSQGDGGGQGSRQSGGGGAAGAVLGNGRAGSQDGQKDVVDLHFYFSIRNLVLGVCLVSDDRVGSPFKCRKLGKESKSSHTIS